MRIDQHDTMLRNHMEHARSMMHDPSGGRGRPAPDSWLGWLHRPTLDELLTIAACAWCVTWLAGGLWYVRRRPLLLVVAAGMFALALASAAGYFIVQQRQQNENRHMLLIVMEEGTPLHKGNGTSYPLHPDVPSLPAGLEARRLHGRGEW